MPHRKRSKKKRPVCKFPRKANGEFKKWSKTQKKKNRNCRLNAKWKSAGAKTRKISKKRLVKRVVKHLKAKRRVAKPKTKTYTRDACRTAAQKTIAKIRKKQYSSVAAVKRDVTRMLGKNSKFAMRGRPRKKVKGKGRKKTGKVPKYGPLRGGYRFPPREKQYGPFKGAYRFPRANLLAARGMPELMPMVNTGEKELDEALDQVKFDTMIDQMERELHGSASSASSPPSYPPPVYSSSSSSSTTIPFDYGNPKSPFHPTNLPPILRPSRPSSRASILNTTSPTTTRPDLLSPSRRDRYSHLPSNSPSRPTSSSSSSLNSLASLLTGSSSSSSSSHSLFQHAPSSSRSSSSSWSNSIASLPSSPLIGGLGSRYKAFMKGTKPSPRPTRSGKTYART